VTRRYKITPLFLEFTEVMQEMLSVFSSVRIKPVNADETFSFLEYYNEVPEFERLRFDGKNVEKQPGVYSFNR